MAASVTITAPAAPVPNYSITQKTVQYVFNAVITSGNYLLGGVPVNFAGYVVGNGGPFEVRAISIATPNSGYSYKFNPNNGNAAYITNLALTTNVVTITAANSFTAGEFVTLNGLTVSTFLNGQTVQVIATGLSSSVFE